jgi:C4-dicarboxylate-specific signal transduction histidine kinase
MARRFGPGLRLQIMAALSVAFVVAFALLGFAAVRLTQRARASDRARHHEATARALAAGLDASRPLQRERFAAMADEVVGVAGVRGVELERGRLTPWARGVTGLGRSAEASTETGEVVRVWVSIPPAGGPTTNLLLLYVAVTGGAILLLAYLALTHLIVRPVEAVTRASERVADGNLAVNVPVRGAAEVARLAGSFNQMAAELRRDRSALEDRLRELEQTTRELESAQEQVLRSAQLASVGRLSAGVAHEIGNPLAAILGLLELARDPDVVGEEQLELLTRAQSETERISAIIRQLLDFARQGADQEAEETGGEADIGAVVADAVALVAPRRGGGSMRVEVDVADALPPVRGSADRLEQVVLNLLLNASDAMTGHGTVHVVVRQDRSEVVLTVRDEGPGIEPEVLDHLFEPFVTTKAVGEGTGLGLAVCHTLVLRVGGTIRADNPEGGGARFEVRLPVAMGSPA